MKTQKNIPKLRFPDFKSEWKQKKYGEVFSFRTTNSFSRENLNYDNGEIKNIHYGDIHTKFSTLFDVTKELVPFINSEIELKRISEDSYCKEGDLIIADASEDYEDVGKCIEIVNLNGEKVLAGLHTILARPDLFKMSTGFNGYLMMSESIRLQIKIAAQGSKVLSISSKRLADMNIVVPETVEQKHIASFFTFLDKKISELKEKKNLLEQYKKGVMQKIFSQELRFKDDKGKDFPKWEKRKLGEITFKVDKKNKKRENLPVYSISNVNGFVPQSEQFEGMDSNERGYDISLYKIIENNTFAYNPARINVGSIGYSGKLSRVIVSSLYVCFKTHDLVNDLFFIYYLNTNHFKDSVIKKGEGGVRIYLFYENFSGITISVPSLPEQSKITNFLSVIDEKINRTKTQLEKTEYYKKGLLQNMFC